MTKTRKDKDKSNKKEPFECVPSLEERGRNGKEGLGRDRKLSPGIFERGGTVDQWKRQMQGSLADWGIVSKDPKCRFPWLIPWPMGTERQCCPRSKKALPKVNPEETKCVYKPLFKTGQVWVWILRGTTVPREARAIRCTGKPCKKKKKKQKLQ